MKVKVVITSLLLATMALSGLLQRGLAQPADNFSRHSSTRPESVTTPAYALLPRHALKSVPSGVEFYEYDSRPLADRRPLLLIHGLLGEFHPFFRWKQLADYLCADQAFQNRYKIYLARYSTDASLQEVTAAFKLALPKFAPQGNLTIVAISMAGTVIHETMKDQAVNRCVSSVLTLGAFFHGSPLFCPDWMRQTIRSTHLSPLCRADRLLAYNLYFAKHGNLIRDYGWDNFDGQRPQVDASLKPQTSELPFREQSPTQIIDQKFIVYAGYLHNRYVPERQSPLRIFLASPLAFIWTTLPAHFGLEHKALRFLNHLIAGAVPEAAATDSKIIYAFNDGISPISSSLLLRSDFLAHNAFIDELSFKNITAHCDAKKARLFENADHLTFIERRRITGESKNVADVLAENEKPRPMFSWILNDLLE